MNSSQNYKDRISDVLNRKEFERSKQFYLVFPEKFSQAPAFIKEERGIAQAFVERSWRHFMEYKDTKFASDRQFVLAAIKQNWEIIKHVVSDVLIDDKEIILSAVKQNGLCL